MEVDYNFPGCIDISLNLRDLQSMQDVGYAVERDGFSGMESKTWVHLPPIGPETSFPNNASAMIESGGDIHVYLNRGFPLPITIDQSDINAAGELIQHYLGDDGTITIRLDN